MRHCPKCGCGSRVIDSRETTTSVRRTRECRKCKSRWSTWEATWNAAETAAEFCERLTAIAEEAGYMAQKINTRRFGDGRRSRRVKKKEDHSEQRHAIPKGNLR